MRLWTSPTISDKVSWGDKQFDRLLTRELHNWAARQNPPASIRTRLLDRARKQQIKLIPNLILRQLPKNSDHVHWPVDDFSAILTQALIKSLGLGPYSLRWVS